MLESHGGEVSLVEFNKDNIAVLQFGGGCQGCGMVDVTLKDGIEKTLIEQIPEVESVKDIRIKLSHHRVAWQVNSQGTQSAR